MSILDGSTNDLAETGNEDLDRPMGTVAYFLVVMVFFMFGAGVLFSFFPTEHSRLKGYAFLLVSIPITWFTLERAIKFFAGLLAIAALRGVYVIFAGHLPSTLFDVSPRLEGIFMTLYSLAGVALCLTFLGRRLRTIDRIALMAFLFSFCYAGAYQYHKDQVGAQQANSFGIIAAAIMTAGLAILAIAWAYDRSTKRRSEHAKP